jgi:hypothetical protein
MKFKKIATVFAASLLVVANAQAGLIYSNVAYGMTNAQNAEAAFISSTISFATENFNDFSTLGLAGFTSQNTGNQNTSWVDSNSTYASSLVGTFTVSVGDVGAGAEENPNNLMIESASTGEFGRQQMLGAGNFWLDSNDAESVKWDLATVNTSFDSLGFYLVDANDSGARLILRYSDGSTSNVVIGAGGLGNGNVAYVTMRSDTSISAANIVFDNNGDMSKNTNDGWAIDNVTVAKVPEPTTLAFLGLGLLGIFVARKR